MKSEEIRDLRLQWSQCIQDGNKYRGERKFDKAERSFRRAFNIARKISRKTGKPDIAVEVTLKTIVQFYRVQGNYVGAGIYYGLTGLWWMQCWLSGNLNSGAHIASGAPAPP